MRRRTELTRHRVGGLRARTIGEGIGRDAAEQGNEAAAVDLGEYLFHRTLVISVEQLI
jgi:hypothetical protein